MIHVVRLVMAVMVAGCAGTSASPTPSTTAPASPTPGPTAPASPTPSPTAPASPTPSPSVSSSPSTAAFFRPPVELAGQEAWGIAVGDFGNDGDFDIVTTNGDGSVSLYLGSGGEAFDHVAASPPPNEGPAAIAVGDLNGDRLLDIVVTHSGVTDNGTGPDDIVVLLANADGTFEKLQRHAGVNPQAVVVADLDGDHQLDLATANDGDHLSIFLGNGDGTFKDPTNFPIGAPYASGIAAADVNRDGTLDLVTANSLVGKGRSDKTVSVLSGRGDGTFGEPGVYDTGGAQPIAPVVADLNGDGRADIATPNGAPGASLSVLLGRPEGGFSPPAKYVTGRWPHSLVAADLDGDGHLDLASGNLALVGHEITIRFGKGDGTFEPPVDVSTAGRGFGIAAAVDLDADGGIDLVLGSVGGLMLLFNAVGP
jgi:hypothetical protein